MFVSHDKTLLESDHASITTSEAVRGRLHKGKSSKGMGVCAGTGVCATERERRGEENQGEEDISEIENGINTCCRGGDNTVGS